MCVPDTPSYISEHSNEDRFKLKKHILKDIWSSNYGTHFLWNIIIIIITIIMVIIITL